MPGVHSLSLQIQFSSNGIEPPPKSDVMGSGSGLASSAYPQTVSVLNVHVKHQGWEVLIPCDVSGKSMPNELDSDPSLVCCSRSIHVGVASSDRIMQQSRRWMHLGGKET